MLGEYEKVLTLRLLVRSIHDNKRVGIYRCELKKAIDVSQLPPRT